MHPIGPKLPISAHVACACVCRQLYVLRATHALVQATVGVRTVIIVYNGVAYTREGAGNHSVGSCHHGASHIGSPSKPVALHSIMLPR